jgi:hypothetical protein
MMAIVENGDTAGVPEAVIERIDDRERFPTVGHPMLCVGGPLHGRQIGFNGEVLLVQEAPVRWVESSPRNGRMR